MSDEREDEKKEPKVLAEVLRLEIVSPDPTSLLAAGHAVAESEARGERRGRNSPGELRLFGHFRVLYRDVDPVDSPCAPGKAGLYALHWDEGPDTLTGMFGAYQDPEIPKDHTPTVRIHRWWLEHGSTGEPLNFSRISPIFEGEIGLPTGKRALRQLAIPKLGCRYRMEEIEAPPRYYNREILDLIAQDTEDT